jgi:hypothetical protein
VDYRDIVPFIFWPWFAFSCYVLVKRRIDRKAADQPPEPAPANAPTEEQESSVVERLVAEDRRRAVAPGVSESVPPEPATPGSSPGRTPSATTPPAPPAPAVGATGALGTIFDAAPPTGSTRRPIAELVSGIDLPCDLTPLVGAERRSGARDTVAFVTRTSDAPTVGRAIGEELRRLGYDLTPRTETEVTARRGDDWLGAAVHADGSKVERGDRPAFPGAGRGGVVVELWTE